MTGVRQHGADGRFRWRANRLLLVFAAIFLPLTIALGFWQLGRGEEKAALLAEYQQREAAPPLPVAELVDHDDISYRRVQARGEFDNRRLVLLQNRVRDGVPGYEVVAPFREASSGRWLLVNRGWLAASDHDIPAVPPVPGPVLISGHLYLSPGDPFTLGAEQWREAWPQVLQNLEFGPLAEQLGESLPPWSLRLDAESPGALVVGWPRVAVSPQQHRAYAVQWFALAVALVLLTIFANSNLGELLRRKRKRDDE